MRTINSSTININNTFDSPRPQSPVLDRHHHQHHHHHPQPHLHRHHDSPPRRSKTPAPSHSTSTSTPRYPPPPPRPSTRAGTVKFPPTAAAAATNADTRCSPLALGFQDQHPHPNQHVLALTTTTTTTTKRSISSSSAPAASSAAKMPIGDNRPRPPQLSAAAAKTVGRTPLTPKIAQKSGQMGLPLVRRTTGNSIASMGGRDDIGPSTAPFLANGVTPRAGSRGARGESTNTTPSGTPNPERSNEGWDHRTSYGFDAGRPSDASNSDSDSKFFRASDARTTLQQPPHYQRPSSGSQKPATFFYANGITAESKRTMSPPISSPHSPMLETVPDPVSSKFFYANGTPDISSRPTPISSGPPSAGSSSSRLVPGRPSTGISSTHGHPTPSRPLSPTKMLQQQPSAFKTSAIPAPNVRPQLSSPPQLVPASFAPSKRRVSIESAPRGYRGHARTGSVPTMDTWTSPKLPLSPPQKFTDLASPPASPGASQPAMTMASILQVAEEFSAETQDNGDDLPSGLQSPTKSTHSTDPVSELVSNARRERKVQDLEITNASLEAINRTLERNLRKQTAELRRYKRLSRSGRFGMGMTSITSSRVPSQALSEVPISLADLSDDDDSMHSEEEDEEEEEPDSLDDSELSSTDSASADQNEPIGEKKLARRNRDERRLQLDLTKHRELLVDSQKINQSLKRCLNWTEVLIKEGQKALEYSVKVSDIKFGGHVLPPPDADDDDASQYGDDALRRYEAGLGPPLPWEKGSQDRDSGIELPVDTSAL